MNAYCNDFKNCPINLTSSSSSSSTFTGISKKQHLDFDDADDAAKKYALFDLDVARKTHAWRCYDENDLDETHSHYVDGKEYCTRDEPLQELLDHCWPDWPVPAPAPTPEPENVRAGE
mgnify:CR=1 FL=1